MASDGSDDSEGTLEVSSRLGCEGIRCIVESLQESEIEQSLDVRQTTIYHQ